MNRNRALAVILVALVVGVGVARADSPAGSPAVVQAGPAPAGAPEPAVVATPREKLSPMHREIFDAVEAERADVKALSTRYAGAALLSEKLEIQKQIEAVKRAGMILVFEIQLRYARAEGRAEVVRQLETAIDAVKNPKALENSGPTVLEKTRAGR